MPAKLIALALMFGWTCIGALAADPPKSEEPPVEDFGRRPRDKRAKLLESTTFDGSSSNRIWSPDGKRLFVSGTSAGVRKLEKAGVTLVLLPVGSFIGLAAGGKEYVTFNSGRGINGVSRIVVWDALADRGDPSKPNQLVGTIDIDVRDGTPVAITDDRRRIFTKLNDPVQGVAKAWFRVLDGMTGEPLRDLVCPAEGETLAGWKFSTTADRLFLAVNTSKGPRFRAIDPITSKVIWDRTIDFAAIARPEALKVRVASSFPAQSTFQEKATKWQHPLVVNFVDSPKWLGVNAIQVVSSGLESLVPGQLGVLLDVATGKDGPALDDLGSGKNSISSISADGKLIAGETEFVDQLTVPPGVRPGPGMQSGDLRYRRQLVVWSAQTSKVLHAWPAPNDRSVSTSFSPTAPLLALIDTERIRENVDANTWKTTSRTTLGLWDLSGLLK